MGTWRFTTVLLCAAFLIASAYVAHAGVNEWTTHGPYNGSVNVLAIDPTTPSTLYAGTPADGVFKSTDSGATWTTANTGLWPPDAFNVFALAIAPHSPSTLYAATESGVFRSTNSGGAWSGSNFPGLPIFDPTTPSTLYALAGGVYRSTDGGDSWSATGLANPWVTALTIDPHTPSTLYAGTSCSFFPGNGCSSVGVFQSTNGGASWSAVNTGLPDYPYVSALIIDPNTPNTLYVGTRSGVFQSTDSGATWSAVNAGLTDPDGNVLRVYTLAIDPSTPSTLYAATERGVFRSTNSGATWSAVNTSLTNHDVFTLAINPTTTGTLYAGTNGAGVFQSTNSGASWSAVNTGDLSGGLVNVLAIDPSTPSTLYAANEIGAFRSTNSGASWSAINTGLTNLAVRALALDPHTPSTLYAGTGDGVFKSTNSGATWTAINTGLTDPDGNVLWVRALAIDPTTPSTLYAGTWNWTSSGGRVFQSTNGGTTWTATGFPTGSGVEALAIDPHTPNAIYAASNGVWQSTNGGSTWSGSNFPGLPIFDPHTPGMLYAGVWGGGVFQSTDGGASWSAINTGLTNLDVRALAIDPRTPSTLYAGTRRGVFDIELTCVVGTGTSASCTELTLDACLPGGAGFNGAVTFNCGGAAMITVTGTKTISADTTIDGGSLITISGGNAVRVFEVNKGTTLNVQSLTIANGLGNYAAGGIVNNGTLNVSNCTFTGNDGARHSCSAFGGAILTVDGSVTVRDSVFSGNTAITLESCGPSFGLGGAICALVWEGTASLAIVNSTFTDNRASILGGAIFAGTTGSEGSLTVTVTNSTFNKNSGYAIDLNFDYERETLTLVNSIIANSTGENCFGPITDGGHNLQFPGMSCGETIPSVDPLLDPVGLKDNGGPTQTIALCTGTGAPSAGCTAASPAIDAGDESVCSTTTGTAPVGNLDQRGFGRPGVGATNCSIGAFEANAAAPCTGDCKGNGQVTVDEILTMVNIALGNAAATTCQAGDANDDNEITVDEILAAVNNALNGCSLTPAEQGCLTSGGTVATAMCCAATGDFPDTCAVGACGCLPAASHDVRVCDCGAGSCFDGSGCVRQ